MTTIEQRINALERHEKAKGNQEWYKQVKPLLPLADLPEDVDGKSEAWAKAYYQATDEYESEHINEWLDAPDPKPMLPPWRILCDFTSRTKNGQKQTQQETVKPYEAEIMARVIAIYRQAGGVM